MKINIGHKYIHVGSKIFYFDKIFKGKNILKIPLVWEKPENFITN